MSQEDASRPAAAPSNAAAPVSAGADHAYRSLLVPLDGSDFGEHALPLALSLARRLGAALRVVHVHVSPWGAYAEPGGQYDETIDRILRERDRAYLDAVVERLAAAADISLSSALLDGPVADAIDWHATAAGAELLVMATQGRGPLARFWLGSVADALVRQGSIPILFVRPQEVVPDLTQEPVLRRLLIPLDGSELAEQILESALALGMGTQAEYTLLRVVQALSPGGYIPAGAKVGGLREPLFKQLQALHRQEWSEAQEYLERVAEWLRARSLAVTTRVVSEGRPAVAILEHASTHGADLITVATHGRGGLKRLLLGSVADKVLRGATTPVLVYRPVERTAPTEE